MPPDSSPFTAPPASRPASPPLHPPLTPPLQPPSPARYRYAILAAFLLAVAIYASTSAGTFIYDDLVVGKLDKRLHSPSRWHLFWTKDYYFDLDVGEGSIDNLYRPLVSMTFAVQYYLHPGNPIPMHVVNVLLYGVCAALAAAVGGRVAGPRHGPKVAWAAGLLFAAHPVHAEAVAAIAGRAELMAMIGLTAALYLHLGGPPTHRRSAGIVACGLLALLSKEQGMLLPGLLLAAEPLRRSLARQTSPPPHPTSDIPHPTSPAPSLPYATPDTARRASLSPLQSLIVSVCFLTGGYIVLREQVLHLKFWWDRGFLDPAVQPMILSQGPDRLLMPAVLLGRYLTQLVFPAHLAFDYSGPVIGSTVSPSDPYLYLGLIAAAVAGVGLLIALVRRAPRAIFLLGAFALTYGVVSNSVSLIGVNYAERLIFTPSLFFVIALAMLLARLPHRAWTAALTLLVAAGAVHAGTYAARWIDADGFYDYTLRTQPRSIRVHQIVADRYTERGRLDDAAAVAASARRLMPDYWDLWLQSAAIAEKRGRLDEAETYFTEAFRLQPRHAALPIREFRARHPRPTTIPTTTPTTGPVTP